LARLVASAQPDVVVAPLDAVAEQLGAVAVRPDVAAARLVSARFRCAPEQVDVLALRSELASPQLRA
jgi:hypothetical protein